MLRHFRLFSAVFAFTAIAASGQLASLPLAIDGYVTRATSPTDFEVNGLHILCSDKTHFAEQRGELTVNLNAAEAVYLGEPVKVYGTRDKKAHTIAASAIVVSPAQPGRVSGQGMIDRVLSSRGEIANTGEINVRADGYPILITTKTASTFNPPLKAIADVGTNVWLVYEGKQRADGVVVAEKAVFTQNGISGGENKVRQSREYDPVRVDPSEAQSALSRALIGVNPKKIPPYKDDALQARVDKIGASLVPEYQRRLPDFDATKIYFRFQLIDFNKWRSSAACYPSGIVLVPRQMVERLENDSQLAAVLAFSMGCALEKQAFREQPAGRKLLAAQLAGDAGGFFVPGLGLATGVVNGRISAAIARHAEEQNGRVSLGLMQDAGYDIYEAPHAWWILSQKKGKDLTETAMPSRSAYLYSVIGTTWRGDRPSSFLSAAPTSQQK